MLWSSLPGSFTEEDSKLYELWAKEIPSWGTLIEIGSSFGKSTACLLTHLIQQKKFHVKVVCVDYFAPQRLVSFLTTLEPWLQQMISGHIGKSSNIDDKYNPICILQWDDKEISRLFENGRIWACFYNGGHSYESVRLFIRDMWPKIMPTGHLGFYNFSNAFPGIGKALSEEIAKPPDHIFGSCADFIKTQIYRLPKRN